MTLPTSFIEDLRGRVADVSTDPDELARTAKDWSCLLYTSDAADE